jgi:hypothetical protein
MGMAGSGARATATEGVGTRQFNLRHCRPCGHAGMNFLNFVGGHHTFVG